MECRMWNVERGRGNVEWAMGNGAERGKEWKGYRPHEGAAGFFNRPMGVGRLKSQ